VRGILPQRLDPPADADDLAGVGPGGPGAVRVETTAEVRGGDGDVRLRFALVSVPAEGAGEREPRDGEEDEPDGALAKEPQHPPAEEGLTAPPMSPGRPCRGPAGGFFGRCRGCRVIQAPAEKGLVVRQRPPSPMSRPNGGIDGK